MIRLSRSTSGLPTSSMADIAFLLIIFFLTTAVIAPTGLLPGGLNRSESGQPLASEEVLKLVITPQGRLALGDKSYPPEEWGRVLSTEGILSRPAGYQLALIIAGPETRWQEIAPLIIHLQKAGIARYAFEER